MRFARPAAAGLGVGMLAGFAVALLRPRLPVRPSGPSNGTAPATDLLPARRPRLPRRVVDATATDTPTGSQAGSDFSGRVI